MVPQACLRQSKPYIGLPCFDASGEGIVPDVTGTYHNAGLSSGLPYYVDNLVTPSIYLWSDGENYMISAELNGGIDETDAWWLGPHISSAPAGQYAPQGTAAGTVTVTDYEEE